MLRDPLAFVWRYSLGWRSTVEDDQPLSLDARAFGELVHELLKRTVDRARTAPGLRARRASRDRESAGRRRCHHLRPMALERSTPPALLWQHTLELAALLALKALTLDEAFQPGTRSWTEVGFGLTRGPRPTPICHGSRKIEVPIPGTRVRIRGRIDRLDLNATAAAVRLSDYKTGAEPKQADQIVLRGGTELQRVVYAVAARHLLPDLRHIVARLVFLGDDTPHPYRLADVDAAIAEAARHIAAACALLDQGTALPGPDAHERWTRLSSSAAGQGCELFPPQAVGIWARFWGFSRVWSCR